MGYYLKKLRWKVFVVQIQSILPRNQIEWNMKYIHMDTYVYFIISTSPSNFIPDPEFPGKIRITNCILVWSDPSLSGYFWYILQFRSSGGYKLRHMNKKFCLRLSRWPSRTKQKHQQIVENAQNQINRFPNFKTKTNKNHAGNFLSKVFLEMLR